ncbi:MAG: hypothetical protein CM1200mP40_23160 [Gammaproteobacteria bacterium]|nr:MAG: hypothetical protein CM1200mP40_23160 [Gammaproteobacteria bacterium]
MQILDYNRILKDLNGLSAQEFISALQESFDVIKVDSHQNAKPIRERQFAIYCGNTWYRLTANSDLINSIDTQRSCLKISTSRLCRIISYLRC